ncbi:hypothetical protein BJ742DRAFT_807114 [Cladochytrium replicatum]|nr:hypothetical protein BJ742DRAFT_807114 [Cladochytrium replicatum]
MLPMLTKFSYQLVVSVLKVLKDQLTQAEEDLVRLNELRRLAEEDPIDFSRKMLGKELGPIPQLQRVINIPTIDFGRSWDHALSGRMYHVTRSFASLLASSRYCAPQQRSVENPKSQSENLPSEKTQTADEPEKLIAPKSSKPIPSKPIRAKRSHLHEEPYRVHVR